MESKKLINEVDLTGGVVPITKAASSLAALIKRSRHYQQPIVVTQKGYPTGVILDVELFTTLRETAERHLRTTANDETTVQEETTPPPDSLEG